MVREAAARLYDVDADSLKFQKLAIANRYDTGTVSFRAKRDKLIDLDKLHESIWATRLSGGTRSGLISIEVTAVGDVVVEGSETVLKVAGADSHFILAAHPDNEHRIAFDQMRSAVERGEQVVSVSGQVDGWSGRWPDVLRQLPPKPRRILVTGFETASSQ
jgi:hypothetical protein